MEIKKVLRPLSFETTGTGLTKWRTRADSRTRANNKEYNQNYGFERITGWSLV